MLTWKSIVLMVKPVNAGYTIWALCRGVRRLRTLCCDTPYTSVPGPGPPKRLGAERVREPVPWDGLGAVPLLAQASAWGMAPLRMAFRGSPGECYCREPQDKIICCRS